MEHYRDVEGVQELQDCHATVSFIRLVAKLRKAMNANHSYDSLRDDDENEGKKVSCHETSLVVAHFSIDLTKHHDPTFNRQYLLSWIS